MSRNVVAVIAATIAVVGALCLGFYVLGSPRTEIRSDLRRTQLLANLAREINNTWSSSQRVLPSNLEKFAEAEKQDPMTGEPFVYKTLSGNKYELCATFAMDSKDMPRNDPSVGWKHAKGDYCFQVDPLQPLPIAPNYY